VQLYLTCIEGSMTVNKSTALAAGEAARIRADQAAPLPLSLVAGSSGAHFMLIEMKRDEALSPW
jgi:hypothetical protein